MAKATRIQRLLLVGLLSSAPLAACGGDDDESSAREDVTGGADEDVIDEDTVVPEPEDVAHEDTSEEDTSDVDDDADTSDVDDDADTSDEDDADTSDEDATDVDDDADTSDEDATDVDDETDVTEDPDQACRDALDADPVDDEAIATACACDTDTWRDFETVTCRPCDEESFGIDDFDLDSSPGFDPETGLLRLAVTTEDIGITEVEATYYWVRFADDGYFAQVLTTATGVLEDGFFVFDLSEDEGYLADSSFELHAVRATGRCGVDRTTRRILLPATPFGDPDTLGLAPCFDRALESVVPISEELTLEDAARLRGAQNEDCALPRERDKIVQWTAPEDGTYRISLEDAFSIGLYVIRGACEAPVESCTDAFGQAQSIELEATAGETFQISLGAPMFSSSATLVIEAVDDEDENPGT